MKKFVMMVMIALAAVGTVSAEKVNAFSYTKGKSNTLWYARVGLSVNNLAGGGALASGLNDYYNYGRNDYYYYYDLNDYYKDDCRSSGSTVGFNFDLGFQKGIGKSGLYWGMELGIGTRGGYEKYDYGENWLKGSMTLWDVKYSPFTIGYKYSLTDNIKIDAHVGVYASYDFAGKDIKIKYNDGDSDKEPVGEIFDEYRAYDVGMQLGAGVWYGRFNLDFSYQRGFIYMASNGDYDLHASNFVIRLGVAF